VTDVSKVSYAQGGAVAMVGTGPFKLEKWTKGAEVDLVKNADYWNKSAVAHLDRVVFKPIADETAILNGLQAGDIDLAQKVSPVDTTTLKADTKFLVVDRGESCNLFHLGINQDYPGHAPAPANDAKIMDNLKIRQAVMYAIDRQSLIDNFYAGQAVIADNWMPPATQYFKAENLPTYDPQKAKDLIADVRDRLGQARHRLLVPVRRHPAIPAGSEGHLPVDPEQPRGRGLQGQSPHRHLEPDVPRQRVRRQVRDVGDRLDLRLGRP